MSDIDDLTPPPSYPRALATHGNPFEPAPAYSITPSEGQSTRAINLSDPIPDISSVGGFIELDRIYSQIHPVTQYNPTIQGLKALRQRDIRVVILHHSLAIRQNVRLQDTKIAVDRPFLLSRNLRERE